MPIALSSLIQTTREDEAVLSQILSSFSCTQDEDIEAFLHNKAVQFENLSKARTYLVCDEEQLSAHDFCLDQLTIYGYVSVALKVLSVSDSFSNQKRKKLDGLSAKIHGERIDDFSLYLIGQLARNSNVPHDSISGEALLQVAYDVIAAAVVAVGGRYMMIECRNNQKLLDFYASNGFEEISRINDKDDVLIQMIRQI